MSRIYNKLRKNFRDTRGVSLLVVFGLTIVLILVAGTVTKLVIGFMQTTTQVERGNKAYFAAESGVELALYDLAAYKDGYQTDSLQTVCSTNLDLQYTDSSGLVSCDDTHQYRFVDFADALTDPNDNDLSGARGFWRLFARTLPSSSGYLIPNPYFVGDKDGELTSDEWGELGKAQPISLSLLTDSKPDQPDNPGYRFTWISDSANKQIIFDPGATWDPSANGNSEDPLFTWTLSGIDGDGEEHTLQGVAWESDIVSQDCDADSATPDSLCFIFDLNDSDIHAPIAPSGDVYAGEDINRNLASTEFNGFNRVSAVPESFRYATPQKYLGELNSAMISGLPATEWSSARLTINLIATLSETSGVPSNSLRYKLVSAATEPWADEYNYIVSEGFAGDVKQTIETRFRRESVIPIFSYVIFQ